ncbi:hypothetical protein [Streptomyces subrutilus]|uniref:Uncharacterized protein n=1 Tax=Streptomyces subrutilus TaxID=36818 RepID=A0A1E5NXY3_9ACTN|nr:hypothetical protein [Streptomyces subrutilus]OEJ21075.1 hypothetical protein BGK67_34850 [Streptomyces subrutilus]
MSTVIFPSNKTAERKARIALIACGERPGKTAPCDSCVKKGDVLHRIACSGALDALAAAVCHSLRGGACSECTTKAERILAVCAESESEGEQRGDCPDHEEGDFVDTYTNPAIIGSTI